MVVLNPNFEIKYALKWGPKSGFLKNKLYVGLQLLKKLRFLVNWGLIKKLKAIVRASIPAESTVFLI